MSEKKSKQTKKKNNQMTFVRKVPLRMDKESALYLDGQSKILNKLYNTLKEEADNLRIAFAKAKEAGHEAEAQTIAETLYYPRGFRDKIPSLRLQREYINRVHASPLKNVALRLGQAIKNHQDSKHGRRKGPAVAWPKFSAWKKDWMSIEYEDANVGWKITNGTQLKLNFGKKEDKRLGIEAILVDPPKDLGAAKCLRIVKEYGTYFAIFTIVKNKRKVRKPRYERIAYIDPNSSNMGVSLDTQGHSILIDNIPGIDKLDKRIDAVKKQRDKKKRNSRLIKFKREDGSMHRHFEPSRRWKRLDKALKVLEHKRRERIKQVLYSTVHGLFDRYDVIGIGNWAPNNGASGHGRKANRTMRGNRYLGQWRSYLNWVALKRRKLAFVLDERGTTRTCSKCGYVKEGGIHPSIRQWTCPGCHIVHGRDENAATNGLKKLLLHLEQSEFTLPCSGLDFSVKSRSTWYVRPGRPRKAHALRGVVSTGGARSASLGTLVQGINLDRTDVRLSPTGA